MTFMAIAGRLGLGVVVDRFDPRLVTSASLASQAAALLIILATDSVLVVWAACALFGFSVGNIITLPPLIINREFSAASFTVVMGLANAISGTVGSLGPALLGLVRGWSGDYHMALVLCIALELVAAALVIERRLLAWRPASPEGRGRALHRIHEPDSASAAWLDCRFPPESDRFVAHQRSSAMAQ